MSDVETPTPEPVVEDPGKAPKKLDLDAARKARREKRGPAPSILFLGKDRPLPSSLPADVLELGGAVAAGDWTQAVPAVRILLGGPVYDELRADAEAAGEPLDLEDVVFLLEGALEVYEVTLPESNASG